MQILYHHMMSPPEEPHLAFPFLVTSLLSLFLVLLTRDFNILVSELAGVNCFWPFIVPGQIYGRSNFGHNFCQLALLGKFMTKI